MKNIIDCAIIGGGPAGLSAGLYSSRGGLKEVIMFEKGMPGGQIMNSSEVENYPGISGRITGMELMEPWLAQSQNFGLKHDMSLITNISKNIEENIFEITKENGEVIYSKTVIVCTGSTPKRTGVIGENEFFGKGVSTCATCDGFFYKNKEVVVIGGGDSALEESLFLSKICKKVYILHRSEKFKASPHTIERINNQTNIESLFNISVKEIVGDKSGVTGIKFLQNDEEKMIEVPGIFLFIGQKINNEVLIQNNGKFLCDVNSNGEVVVDLKMKTSLKGLYCAGDIRINAAKQVVCAASDGAIAGIESINYIDENF
jgi:thioredoxin reductase (NADPH)